MKIFLEVEEGRCSGKHMTPCIMADIPARKHPRFGIALSVVADTMNLTGVVCSAARPGYFEVIGNTIKGAMAFFSWPSQGSPRGYAADEAIIEASEGVITDLMTDFAERSDADPVHVIGFGMGVRAALRAVNRIAKAKRGSGKLFGQIILAAADVDADVFRALSAALQEVASRTTLYVQHAIWHSRRRAG